MYLFIVIPTRTKYFDYPYITNILIILMSLSLSNNGTEFENPHWKIHADSFGNHPHIAIDDLEF